MTSLSRRSLQLAAWILLASIALSNNLLVRAQDYSSSDSSGEARSKEKDSYRYYGPNGLWKWWNYSHSREAAEQRLGRDTWIHWTWGNQKILRTASVLAGSLPAPVSIDYFRLLDSRNRKNRFRDLGLINEPNCEECTKPEYGLWLDTFKGDSFYPVDYKADVDPWELRQSYSDEFQLKYPGTDQLVDLRHYGRPSGIIGIRLFKNPLFKPDYARFAKEGWNIKEYFKNPGKVEPPYLVGFSCGFCHMGFDPNNPPANAEKPRWENLAANIGNQYLREGEIFLGKGRILFGDKNPGRTFPDDPYDTKGLTKFDFLYQYAATQQPGTSETSRFSYDFLNNPNTINPIFGLRYRPMFNETTPWGLSRNDVVHILKDGSDSVGIQWALMRVPVNIGCEGDYWVSHLFNPSTGRRAKPFRIADVIAGWPDKERNEAESSLIPFPQDQKCINAFYGELRLPLAARMKAAFPMSPYGNEEHGEDFLEAWRRGPSLAKYLASYEPAPLIQAQKIAAVAPPDGKLVARGAEVFGMKCARCHSSKRPYAGDDKETQDNFFQWSATQPRFLEDNFLSDDERYSAKEVGTNMARSLGTNAIDADIWAEFSSKNYKALAPIGRIKLGVPVFPPSSPPNLPLSLQAPISVEFEPPGGGRGYYRTPSLISMWATAPYLHNNSVGDYYVVDANDQNKHYWVSADGAHCRDNPSDSWKEIGDENHQYRIDVSVAGRLKMFEDAADKLLNPAKRDGWVKRVTADCTLIPDLDSVARQFAASLIRDLLAKRLREWLAQNNLVEFADPITRAVESESREPLKDFVQVIRQALGEGGPLGKALKTALEQAANDLLHSTITNVQAKLDSDKSGNVQKFVSFDEFEKSIRPLIAQEMGKFQLDLHYLVGLPVKKGIPVNLFANLSTVGMAQVLPAHLRFRHDPRALAEALLQMSDCPDLVEDHGHTYGAGLPDADKAALIAFLKTL